MLTPIPRMPRRLPAERMLLAIAALFILVNFLGLALIRAPFQLTDLWPVLVWGLSAASGHVLLERYLPRRDPLLFPLAMFLTGWGLVIIDRVAPEFASRQTIWLALAAGAMLVAALLPHILHLLRRFRYILLVAGLITLASTILLGTNPSGQSGAPQLWLGFGPVFFQPSEALKIILVVFLASYLSEQYLALRAGTLIREAAPVLTPRIAGPIVLMSGLSLVMLVWQRDLGTAALFFVVFSIMLYISTGRVVVLVAGLVLMVAGSFAGYALFDVVQLRIDVWLNPWPEANGRAFQIVQSLLAVASGGVFGQGVGQGAPYYVPVAHSDFVFAALAEEWGLLGAFSVIGSIGVLVARGMRIAAMQQGHPLPTLLAVGLSMLIGVQSLLIMGGVLRMLPLTGVTLPYLSYGGSSLVVSFIIIGLLLRLSANGR